MIQNREFVDPVQGSPLPSVWRNIILNIKEMARCIKSRIKRDFQEKSILDYIRLFSKHSEGLIVSQKEITIGNVPSLRKVTN